MPLRDGGGKGCARHFGCAGGVGGREFRIVSRWAVYVCNPAGVKKTGGCLFFQRAQALAPVRTPVSYESTVKCALLFPFTVTLRRFHDACINQRIDSLPCPALFLNVSGAASPLGMRSLLRATPKFHGRGFHQTATISLRRLELHLDYAGGGGKSRGGKVGCG